MQFEIEEGGGQVFDGGKALPELARGAEPAQEVLRHRRAGPIVPRMPPQILRRRQPMLEDLRRKLDEIAPDRGARLRAVAHPAQEPVQSVAEFVEQRAGVVEAQQSRLAPRKIVVVDDDRQDRGVEIFLVAKAARPGARALAGPREIVVQEEADRRAIPVAHLPHPYIRVITREVGPRRKAQAEEAAGGVEGRFDHVVEDEIGLHLCLVEIVLGAADAFGPVAPVPGLDRLVLTGLARRLLRGRRAPRPPFSWPAPRPRAAALRRRLHPAPSNRRADNARSRDNRGAAPARRARS